VAGKSQDDIVLLLRNVEVGGLVRLTVSRQSSSDPHEFSQQPTTTFTTTLDSTDGDDVGCRVSTSNFEPTLPPPPPGEWKEKQSSNGASSPALCHRCNKSFFSKRFKRSFSFSTF